MNKDKFYDVRDAMALDIAGGYYCRHVSAMTEEELDRKSDIAAELGWRDMQIADLQRKVEALAAEVQAIRWASGQVYAKGYNHGHLNTADGLPYAEEKDLVIRGGETLCEYIDPDHCGVATDAILAEVGAKAVEACANALLSNDDISCEHEYPMMREFAEKLRKESGQ